MRRFLIFFASAFWAGVVLAQSPGTSALPRPTLGTPPVCTVATLNGGTCGFALDGNLAVVSNSNGLSCGSAGSSREICVYNSVTASWEIKASSSLSSDSVGTLQLDDGSATPSAGDCIAVSATGGPGGGQEITYTTCGTGGGGDQLGDDLDRGDIIISNSGTQAELDAAAVRNELEAVLRLPQMQEQLPAARVSADPNPANYTAVTPDVESHLAGIDVKLDMVGLTTDSVGTLQLDDGSATPSAGACIAVSATGGPGGGQEITYTTCGTAGDNTVGTDQIADSNAVTTTDQCLAVSATGGPGGGREIKYVDCGSGSGSFTPMTADIDQAAFQFTKPPITFTTPQHPAAPQLIAGSNTLPLYTQEWSVGPMNVCTTSSNVAQQNACNDDTDCIDGGFCERAGSAAAGGVGTAQETYDITFNQTRGAVFPIGFAQDNVWSMFCANLGPECGNNNPANPNHHAVKHNWEIDYRPGGAANDDKRLTEWYLSFFPPADVATEHVNASHLRTPFWQTNMKPNDNRGSTANTLLNSSVSLWVPPSTSTSSFVARDYVVGGLWVGSNSYPRPIAGVTPASTGLNPQTAWTVHTGTSWGFDDPGMLGFRSTAGGDGGSSGTSASGHIATASDTKYIADQEINSSIQVSNNQLSFGAASFGVCNGEGNEVLGERCIDNRDCNNGDFWDVSLHQGICVKGNGIDDNGTSDGVCLADATCNAGDCDGSVWDAGDACTINADCVSNNCTNSLCVAPLTYRDNIVSLCDAPLDGEVRDNCDNDDDTVNSQCVDIQRFFINEAGATIVSRNATYYDDVPGSHSEAERMIFGYCSSDGTNNSVSPPSTGSPEDEGRTCVVGSSQCASGTCEKPAHSFRLGDTILIDNILHFETDSETPLLHNQTSGLFGKGDELVGSADFMHSKFTVGGPRAMRIGLMQGMLFKSPSITAPSAGAHRLGGTHDGVIKIEDQWAYAATQGVITSDDWTPPAIWAKPHTALNVSSFEAPLLRFDTGNFNTGSWLIEDMRLWVDDTNNVWRQKFSRATSETDGEALLATPNVAGAHFLMVCDSNGGSLNTGTLCCDSSGAMSCVDADEWSPHEDTAGNECSTTRANAVRFWAMCQ